MKLLIWLGLLAGGIYFAVWHFTSGDSVIDLNGSEPPPGDSPAGESTLFEGSLERSLPKPSRPPTVVSVLRRYEFLNRQVPPEAVLSNFETDGLKMVVDPVTNSVVWRGPADFSLVLTGLDKAQESVRLECIFVLVRLSEGEDFGVDWILSPISPVSFNEAASIPGGGLSADLGSISLGIRHRSAEGKLEVISRPSVVLLEGEESEISSGREIATMTTESQLGTVSQGVTFRPVELAVQASFLKLGDYRLDIRFQNSDVGRQVELATGQVPELITQRVNTAAMVKRGMWYSAGSVIVDNSEESKDSPVAMLFGGDRTREILRSEVGLFVRLIGPEDEQAQPVSLPEPLPDAKPAIAVQPQTEPFWKRWRLPTLSGRSRSPGRTKPPHRR